MYAHERLGFGMRLQRGVTRTVGWFDGARFPVFVLAALGWATIALALMLWVPTTGTPLEAFAAEFRAWCFGQDVASGQLQWAYVLTTFTSPLLLGAFIVGVWATPLRDALATPRSLIAPTVSALVLVLVLAWAFPQVGQGRAPVFEPPLAALRTAQTPPDLDLIDQDGTRVRIADLRGRVVLVTGVYATCGLACPMILGQAKRVVAALPPEHRSEVTVLGVTLDPARDDIATRAGMARAQDVAAPAFHLLGGDPATVERALDALDISRRRDSTTGAIEHANVFVVVDRAGRVAYRFGLGERNEARLLDAVRQLVAERR